MFRDITCLLHIILGTTNNNIQSMFLFLNAEYFPRLKSLRKGTWKQCQQTLNMCSFYIDGRQQVHVNQGRCEVECQEASDRAGPKT